MISDWKESASYKRRAQASSVILLETEDPKRVDELLAFVTSEDYTTKKYFNVELQRRVLVDPWEGLSEWNVDQKRWEPIREETATPFSMMGADIGSSMRALDRIIKDDRSVAVIANITSPDLARVISPALQNFAYHPKVLQNKSTIFVVTPDTLLFDEHTRRKCVIIEPPFSTEEERKEMLDVIANEFNKEYEKIILSASSGLTLHDVETAVLESMFRNKAIELSAITATKMELMRKYGYELMYPRYGWETIGGYETLKQYYQDNVIKIIKDDVARAWGVGASRGILMFGLGGTGKSLFAKAMAKELALPFIKVSSADFFRGIVGETERAVKTLQKVAEANAPCIVFFDEIDQIALRRDMVISTDSGVGRRAMNMLMDWLGDDERRSIMVGATNVISQMDPAFIRAGRFDEKICLFPPDFDARKQIIQVHTQIVRKIPLDKGLQNKIETLAERTALWTGAEIELLCVASARTARSRNHTSVSMSDFKTAFEEVTVNMKKREDDIREFIKVANDFASNRRLLKQQLEEYVKKEKGVTRLKAFAKEIE